MVVGGFGLFVWFVLVKNVLGGVLVYSICDFVGLVIRGLVLVRYRLYEYYCLEKYGWGFV